MTAAESVAAMFDVRIPRHTRCGWD